MDYRDNTDGHIAILEIWKDGKSIEYHEYSGIKSKLPYRFVNRT